MANLEKDEQVFNREFIANFTHQLTGPLQSIEANCQNIVEKVVPKDKIEKTLSQVVAQAKECIELVRSMAMIANILSADKEVLIRDMSGHELCTLLIELAQNYAVLANRKNCKVEVLESDDINKFPKVAVNRELLRQAIGNLLDNAVKYSTEKTTISISAKRNPDNDNSVFVYVTNKGIGVPEADRERIFEAGYRAENATQTLGSGTGAGLWLVRKMMEKIGGSISCDNISKESTRFKMELPRINRRSTKA